MPDDEQSANKQPDDCTDEQRPGPDEPATARGEDVVLLHGRTQDGEGVRALRARHGRLELAEVRPLKEGRPLAGSEVIRLRPRKEAPFLCDVETQYDGRQHDGAPRAAAGRAGPPRVSSVRYRRNWEDVFGSRPRARSKVEKKSGGQLPN